ncbi:MAG: superoxide dismutase [Sphingobium sp.]|nr:MAG: superoxide dismutase [Sphingobium sp.]
MKATAKATRALPMMTAIVALGLSATSIAHAGAKKHAGMPVAKAALLAGDGSAKGEAKVVETPKGLEVMIHVTGLPAGTHAAHIHTTGACTAPDFTSAGGHWNPTKHQHGKDNPQGMHMGDMPNIVLNEKGEGHLKFTIPGGKLTGGDTPLLDTDGAAVVIHAAADDMKTDPTGNAGGRLACGVLTAA